MDHRRRRGPDYRHHRHDQDDGRGRERKVLSKSSWEAQVGANLVGFGHADPKCPVCRQNSTAFNYGLGVLNLGPWITQSKGFAGCDAMVGYLPSKKLSIAVVVTYGPDAFDERGTSRTPTRAAKFSPY